MAKKPHLGTWDRVRAGLLLEGELRRKHGGDLPHELPPAVLHFRELPILARIGYVRSWLMHIKPEVGGVLAVCEALINHVRTVRDEELNTLRRRREFITESRKVWPEIQRIVLHRVVAARALGDERAAQSLEVRLLSWCEQFENRLLLEEIREARKLARVDAKQVDLDWSNRWGFTEVWKEQELTSWNPRGVWQWREARTRTLGAGHLDRASVTGLQATCLREVGLENSGFDRSEHHESTEPLEGGPGFSPDPTLTTDPAGFWQIVPEAAVWFRTLFDADGTLRWWAWQRQGTDLQRLASGQSERGAQTRLERANLAFDLTVERTWDAYKRRSFLSPESVDAGTLDVRNQFLTALQHVVVSDAHRLLRSRQEHFAFVNLIQDGLNQLRDQNPALAAVGSCILDEIKSGVAPNVICNSWNWEQWQLGLTALDDPWPKELTDVERDSRRRRELDDATETHLAALERELDLSSLADQSREWDDTDLVFQVQGPLLAMPLAWLNFGGKPLFRSVASTSTCISLTLRYNAAMRCGEWPTPSRNLLSVQWEEIDKRNNAHGLPLLHSGLRTLVGPNHFWALGDSPQASRGNLVMALGRKAFGQVVIAAHGRPQAAGIKLADSTGYFCGEDADFSNVDLLVLVSCAVGRMSQQTNRDVEGLYARLATRGARCVVAARWPISDVEAACLTVELVNQYLAELDRKGRIEPFSRARSLNRARHKLIDHSDAALRITPHQAAAFDIFGLV